MLFDVSLPFLNLMARWLVVVGFYFSHLHYALSNGRQLEDISPFIAPGLFLGYMKQFPTFGSIFGRPNLARFDIEKGVRIFLNSLQPLARLIFIRNDSQILGHFIKLGI